ncbi:hypothetical protein FRUB_07172 [Fimbriiglobus ruber]|uniref:Uncharacterized protein n=1 Tax=Fimbriiglobus ruber TaxID=1908690 RepID=A0A225D9C0_9BACT|nr:hypothetical protein FRUB_07172 [Fimbriiglobus ruber]
MVFSDIGLPSESGNTTPGGTGDVTALTAHTSSQTTPTSSQVAPENYS